MNNKIKYLNITGIEVSKEDRLINDYQELLKVVEFFKKEGKKIVYTSGVYDLFHIGHARYLEKAKQCGDILIVGIDSDEWTKERKGKDRPIVPLEERWETLVHNRSVNIVTVLHNNERTDELLREMKPDVLVLSKSTQDSPDFVEKMQEKLGSFCGKIEIFEPQATTSTSARIRYLSIDGSKVLYEKIKNVCEQHFGKEVNKS